MELHLVFVYRSVDVKCSWSTDWISDSCNAAAWALASSMIAVGLSWSVFLLHTYSFNLLAITRRQAISAISVGHVIIAVIMVLNGTIGARLHVAFPVVNRSSFGFWFSYFSVVSRIVLAMFWFGVQVSRLDSQTMNLTSLQTYTGSECLYQMLKAIWPSTARIPNHLSLNAGITTTGSCASPDISFTH